MKKRDWLIVLAVLLVACAAFFYWQRRTAEATGTAFIVTIDGEEKLRASLAEERTYTFEQEDGSRNVLRVKGGDVYMLEANCRDGLCIRQGHTHSAAKPIVCLPHSLVITVVTEIGGASLDSDLDVIIQ